MTLAFKLTGHTDFVTHLTFSPDGKLLASSGDDCTARLWDLSDRCELTTFKASEKPVNRVGFVNNGKELLSVPQMNYSTVYVWDVQSEKAITTVERTHDDYGDLLATSPDGTLFATAAQNQEVKLWDATSRTVKATLEGLNYTPRDLRFSPDGKYLAAVTKISVALWIVARGKMRAAPQITDGEPNSIAFSPDSAWLALGQSSYGSGKPAQFNISDGIPRPGYNPPDICCSTVAYSPDGKWLAVHNGSDSKIIVLDAATGAVKVELQGGSPSRSAGLAYSPDGKWLVAGSQNDILVFNAAAIS